MNDNSFLNVNPKGASAAAVVKTGGGDDLDITTRTHIHTSLVMSLQDVYIVDYVDKIL
jgi:cobalamin biosynthesis protein CbiD